MLEKLYQRAYSAYAAFHTNTTVENYQANQAGNIPDDTASTPDSLSGSSQSSHQDLRVSDVDGSQSPWFSNIDNQLSYIPAIAKHNAVKTSQLALAYDGQVFAGSHGYANPGPTPGRAQSLPGIGQHHSGMVSLAHLGHDSQPEGSQYVGPSMQTAPPFLGNVQDAGGHQQMQDMWTGFVHRLGLNF